MVSIKKTGSGNVLIPATRYPEPGTNYH